MRLRYIYLRNTPPFNELQIVFQRAEFLNRRCTIRFVVGVNGTGKSQLLRAITQTFIALERQEAPPFAVDFAYDLGTGSNERTLLLQCDGRSQVSMAEFRTTLPHEMTKADWEALAQTKWSEQDESDPSLPLRNIFVGLPLFGSGSVESYLPSTLLAYTSGANRDWRRIFAPYIENTDPDTAEDFPKIYIYDDTVEWRRDALEVSGEYDPTVLVHSSIGHFVTEQHLRFAVCALTLQQAIADFRRYPTIDEMKWFANGEMEWAEDTTSPSRLRQLLDSVDWLWPISLTFQLHTDSVPELERPRLAKLEALAAARLQPELTMVTGSPTFHFDLLKPVDDEGRITAEALYEAIGGENPTPYSFFRQLDQWHKWGMLHDIRIVLQKRHVEDLLTYEMLSDGERVFLGRMALFQLLTGQDDALFILDEPETHFNDVWKREIVDIIDDSLRDDASEVVIATHSSIALTDVFDEEIVLLVKENGQTVAKEITSATFGADPSEIMVRVFGATDSIGKRSLEYLDGLLARDWRPDQREELQNLIENVGPGYHRSELRTVLRRLNATQD